MPTTTPPTDTILFRSASVTVGRFDCPVAAPGFHDTGPIGGFLSVFPRTSVAIHPEGNEPVLADPSITMLYNRGQAYRRAPISPRGDMCEWFALEEPALRDLITHIDPNAADDDNPIRFTHAPCPPRLYLLQRIVVRALRRNDADPLEIEESTLRIFETALRAAYDARSPRTERPTPRADTSRAHRAAVDAVRAALAESPDADLSLDHAAAIACLSPCHLSRVFRAVTGRTLSQYRNDLRLVAALERIADHDTDLTNVALAAGFSSHSHLTNRFRQRFGITPSALRRDDDPELLRALRKSVQATIDRSGHSSGSRGRRSAA